MTEEEIQTKAAVWKMVGELGFEEAFKRLSTPPLRVWKTDPEYLRKTADTLDEEAQTWAEGFAVRDKRGWVFPDNEECRHGHARYVRLTSAAQGLRNFSVRIDKHYAGSKVAALNLTEKAIVAP